ncbi:hypothetical protein MNBD_GAMMA16-1162 [hydrothermal vent metagenome]|uniref:Glycosyl transferase family 1 domain-containing protein n=1 Tax=hydrothermal vent metagenome TaxID=652676 RepID=A0A3B1A6T6_9ZZZZ
MLKVDNGLYIVWKVYQRRVESIGGKLDLVVKYIHYSWEEKSKFFKALSYILKLCVTLAHFIRYRPKVVILQLPPTPLLYLGWLYCKLSGATLVADCHNAMIQSFWVKWPLVSKMLAAPTSVLVHNEQVLDSAHQIGINAVVIRDPLPETSNLEDSVEKWGLEKDGYVLVPWNFAPDEPLEEFAEAARLTPHIQYVSTWFVERLSSHLRNSMPENILFTGFLEADDFNCLFANAGAVLSLTTREGTQSSAASEAISFEIPLVLSDIDTARKLYKDAPVFVQNTPISIVKGIETALKNRPVLRKKLAELKVTMDEELNAELTTLIKLLNLNCKNI